ncbi:hypothetical protein M433DRAFT_268661 [Acidomyces richmondensis BFW]|nr:MAG: hypothetical protein FE78DRAFT_416911 [Acidomyces sp. 'richmondensis']KYG45166.1 hypothetical protein M433DRAFT_268661 [Acidomyces richmondensis BFW]
MFVSHLDEDVRWPLHHFLLQCLSVLTIALLLLPSPSSCQSPKTSAFAVTPPLLCSSPVSKADIWQNISVCSAGMWQKGVERTLSVQSTVTWTARLFGGASTRE